MPETFAQYLEKWLKQSTGHGLNNPLVKMPVKRFRRLQESEFGLISGGGVLSIGTLSDPVARNLHRNYQTRIRERGEHCAFICFGSVEMPLAGTAAQPRVALFPISLKRVTLIATSEFVKVNVTEDEPWQLNPVLLAHLTSFGIQLSNGLVDDPPAATVYLKSQLGNRATRVEPDSFVGLFSSQQMVVQSRLDETQLRMALASNAVVKAKIEGTTVPSIDLGEISDNGLEDLGLVLPSDDSQLRVVQLSDQGVSLQVEGPPGTGKSQTIANIISNALLHSRNVLLVCDKKAAIVQVEERLSNCGLKPAILNLHDEDLDKREFLKQATSRFAPIPASHTYPFDELRETRKTLNERVTSGRSIVHPSLQVSNREALSGLLRLRRELKDVPNIPIANWQALSKERLTKLLGYIGEWAEFATIITNRESIWNHVSVDSFANNPNAPNELEQVVFSVAKQLETLETVQEVAAALGVEWFLESGLEVAEVLELARAINGRPPCHPQLIGNPAINLSEVAGLKRSWNHKNELEASHHPVSLSEVYSDEVQATAVELLSKEKVDTWEELSTCAQAYSSKLEILHREEDKYVSICDQIGLVYSPLLKVRRGQLQAVTVLGQLGASVPREWWTVSTTPVLTLAAWKSNFQACASAESDSPLPLHFLALERIAETHLKYVEAKAEHGFNVVSYCLHFVNDRKCKYALRQVFPKIPHRRFKQWQEVTLTAVAALPILRAFRAAAHAHPTLVQLSSAYLTVAHENGQTFEEFLNNEEVLKLEKATAFVEKMRGRNDFYSVSNTHWQTYWEFPNPRLNSELTAMLTNLDSLEMPREAADNVQTALNLYEQSRKQIQDFLSHYETTNGDRTKSVLEAFEAQKEFAKCTQELEPLKRYLGLQDRSQDLGQEPNWDWLQNVIHWRDEFERMKGDQRLDIDSSKWRQLESDLRQHQTVMAAAYSSLAHFFDSATECIGDRESSEIDYEALKEILGDILQELPLRHLWLQMRRWQDRIAGIPELKTLWEKVRGGVVQTEHSPRLFCFNLLRLCKPIAEPHGVELKQALKLFCKHDEKLSSWILEHLKTNLAGLMQRAASTAALSDSKLRHLAGLQRIRGTVRELVNSHVDYLLNGKPCWMLSPTSLANLVDSSIFEDWGIPFDLVIFDEASQIRVLDGLLSMAFGKQVIIVGDRNQLPPTNFFSGFTDTEADGEAEDFGVSESLLDEFAGVFEEGKTQTMLMSHYRSETPDLIRFSNDWFYGGKLELYPPAHIAGIGRRLHYVPNGIYSEVPKQRNNPVEAEEVVKLIEQHVRDSPHKSLGVVTMNIPQMELIDARLQMFTSDDLKRFCADESKFFLRNLEFVQGDEMDRIILSLTYGKGPTGTFSASILGPLTKSGGERRLNVAITRSRSGLTVVSSLRTSDLEATGAQSKGFQCLREFLRALENTQHSRDFGIGNKRFERKDDGISNAVYCESPFEERVVEFLENEGYEIECQYGAGKFRLDIVVKERGKNLLAIECDGAGYHSSLVARTRDRARERLLKEKYGWRIHRVWSTNWWFFEQQEKESIVEAINAARIHES